MGGEPVTQDWELIVGRDLAASLIPHGQLRRLQRPVDLAMLPAGAHGALAASVGSHGLEDLLLVPAVVRPTAPSWRRRCQYAPMCVLGIGERGLGLWADAPPSPGVRVVLPFGGIAGIERHDDGSWRRLTVSGDDVSFSVWYDADGDASADIWTRRLRLRAAEPAGPLPEEHRTTARSPSSARSRNLRPFLAEPGDEAAVARWRSLPGRGSCLLAVTGREIISVNSARALNRPWRRSTRALYVPRGTVTEAVVTGGTLLLRSAITDVHVPLPSRRLAAAASRWLGYSLAGHDP